LRERIRCCYYSLRTEQSYVYWVRWFVRYSGLRHPREMGASEVRAFLTYLATERHVSASTHRQALCAILFLYREVLGVDLPWMQEIGRPKARVHIPVVLSRDEVARLLAQMDGTYGLIARVLYGAGLRLMECMRLRVKDVDFERGVIIVRGGKGGKDRVVMLPESLRAGLRTHIEHARQLWAEDRARHRPGVELPEALAAKFPRAGESWAWHWVFPAPSLSVDPRSGARRRHHLFEQTVGRALARAVQCAGTPSPLDGLAPPASADTFPPPRCREPQARYPTRH
jgi:integron integrase